MAFTSNKGNLEFIKEDSIMQSALGIWETKRSSLDPFELP